MSKLDRQNDLLLSALVNLRPRRRRRSTAASSFTVAGKELRAMSWARLGTVDDSMIRPLSTGQ